MCGRFTMRRPVEEVVERFNVDNLLFTPSPRYNIAPSQRIAAITANGARAMDGYRWGLVPAWAQDVEIGNRLINARAETLTEKPAFKKALRQRRCLIPADGFYEWKKIGKQRQPIFVRRRDNGLFAFAGLWDEWQAPDRPPLRSCAIITTAPNSLIAPIHHRMAAILQPADEARWLAADEQDAQKLLDLIRPYPDEELAAYTVSQQVNSPIIDAPECIEPVDPSPAQGSLFE
jgi:putative SOS response-associated peptidase YedK